MILKCCSSLPVVMNYVMIIRLPIKIYGDSMAKEQSNFAQLSESMRYFRELADKQTDNNAQPAAKTPDQKTEASASAETKENPAAKSTHNFATYTIRTTLVMLAVAAAAAIYKITSSSSEDEHLPPENKKENIVQFKENAAQSKRILPDTLTTTISDPYYETASDDDDIGWGWYLAGGIALLWAYNKISSGSSTPAGSAYDSTYVPPINDDFSTTPPMTSYTSYTEEKPKPTVMFTGQNEIFVKTSAWVPGKTYKMDQYGTYRDEYGQPKP
jgi:hypothetical protein